MGKAEWALGAVLLSAVVVALAASHIGGEPDNILYHYQGLLTGILALGSALWAGILLRRQITQAEKIERDRVVSKREAERAMLPVTLAALMQYSRDCGDIILEAMHPLQSYASLPPKKAVPPLPLDHLDRLKGFAEFATSRERIYIARLISSYQILWTRMAMVAEMDTALTLSLMNFYFDAAETSARAEALFKYARHSTNEFPSAVTFRHLVVFFDEQKILSHGSHPDIFLAKLEHKAKGNLDAPIRDR